MKKFITYLLFVAIISNISSFSFADDIDKPTIYAESAILIDANTGKILYEKNPHKQLYPASTTKIMTGLLALEKGDLDDTVVVDDETPFIIEGSHIALEPGEELSLRDLVNALLIESANDSAVSIAKHISGSVEEFAKLMNKRAKELGAKNTNFVNPNGLPNEDHVTTAYDLAMIAKHAIKNQTFKKIVGNYTYQIEPTNKKSETRYLKSANRLLYSNRRIKVDGKIVPIKYEGADGIKTGYTAAAQQCLVSTAKRGNLRLISVVLRDVGTNVYVDTHKLFNYGFENFDTLELGFAKEFINNVKVEQGDIPLTTAIIGQTNKVTIPKNRGEDIKKIIKLPDKITAPVTKNQVLGHIEYILDGKVISTNNIVSAAEINQKPMYQVVRPGDSNFILRKWWSWVIILFIMWRIFIAFKRRRRKKKKKYSYDNY